MNLEQALRNGLDKIRSGQLTNEAQVKQAVILPILRELGWDDADPREFVPELPVITEVGNGSVDYALCRVFPSQRPLIFIETKKLGNVDVAGEGQLFRYAANQGVPFLVLTNGDVWNFYLAMAAGTPAERLVYRAELTQEEKLTEYAGFFQRYLDKARVLSGSARQDAEQDKESEGNRLTAQNAIPECWQGLLNEPNDELLKLLVDAVEKNCGIRPDPDNVKAFLKDQHSITPQVITLKPSTSSAPKEAKSTTQKNESTRSKVIGFVLDGRQRNCRSGVKTIAEILIEFQKRDHTFMTRFAPKTIGRNRRLVSQNPDDIYDNPNLQGQVRDLGNGWWMATNIGTKTITQSIKGACEVVGIGYGTQMVLLEQ